VEAGLTFEVAEGIMNQFPDRDLVIQVKDYLDEAKMAEIDLQRSKPGLLLIDINLTESPLVTHHCNLEPSHHLATVTSL